MTWVAVGVTGGSALLGYLGARNAPSQQTTTQNQGGSSQTQNFMALDPLARANVTYGLQNAQDLYRQGGGVSPLFGQAQQGIQQSLLGNMSFGGYQGQPATAPTSQAAAGYQARSVNPYADLAFQNASRSTQNQLTGEFARAGRNVGARLPARSEQLQNLAAGIYGPAYEQEAQRQFGAQEAMAGRQTGVSDANASRLYGAQQNEQQRQFAAQEAGAGRGLSAFQSGLGATPYFSQTPENIALNQYLQQVGQTAPMLPSESVSTTNQTGNVSQTNPLYSNPYTGALGGALLGSQLFPAFQGAGQQQNQAGIPYSGGWQPGTGSQPASSYFPMNFSINPVTGRPY